VTTYPLITLNTRQHVARRGEREDDGARDAARTSARTSVYDGIEPALVGTACSQAVYNYWYARANGTYRARRGRDATGAASLAIASFAGCVNVLMTLPIWTIVTKMQADVRRRDDAGDDEDAATTAEGDVDAATAAAKARARTDADAKKNASSKAKRSFFDVAREVVRDGGVCGLWQGLTPSLVMVANPALQYAFYETVAKWRLKRDRKTTLTAPEIFVFGACAKFGATVLTYPLMVVKSRLQVVSKDMADERMRYRGTAHAVRRMAAEEGLGVFYKGIETKLTQTILAAALMFTVKEKLAESVYAARRALV
jgi:adenine nucleotide transporter 17